MNVHIYRAKNQPATRYLFDLGDGIRHWFVSGKRSLFPCFECRKRRWAKNLFVQVYYDGERFFCREGKGCRAK